MEYLTLKNSDLKNDISNEQLLTNAIIFIDESHYGVSSEKNILMVKQIVREQLHGTRKKQNSDIRDAGIPTCFNVSFVFLLQR